MDIKDFIERQLKSPIKLLLLVGFVCILLLPPFIPAHIANYTIDISPPNRMRARFLATPDATEFDNIPILRQSISSVRAENDILKSANLPGYSYENYLKRFSPIPPPTRDWVYFADFDADNRTDLAYLSCDNDSTFLYFFDALSKEKKRQVYFPHVLELRLAYTRYLQRPGDSLLYVMAASKEAPGEFRSRLFSYDYELNHVVELCCLDNIAQTYMFEDYLGYLLLTVKHRDSHDFYFYDLDNHIAEKLHVETPELGYIVMPTVNIQVEPYLLTSDHLFNRGDRLASISHFNIDSLFLNKNIVLEDLPHDQGEGARMRVKYARDGVVFYTVEDREGESHFYKYINDSKESMQVKHNGGAHVGQVLFYGDIDGNGRKNMVFTDVRLGKESICVQEEGDYYDIVRYVVDREKILFNNCLLLNEGRLYFETKGITWELLYSRNPLYYLRWLINVSIVTFFGFLGFLIAQVKEAERKKQQEVENKVLQLQLENVQKRIDPHFMFNALNNLGSLILKGEKNASYDYLSNISGMLYKALQNRSILVTIEEELSFCSLYLEIQQKRFVGKFDFEMFVDDQLDISHRMPSNILNSMAGNCIKHGFANIDYKGLITIEFAVKGEGMLIVVEDNGKGRSAPKVDVDPSKSTGTGLEICNQYVKLLNQNRKSNLLSFAIIDLFDDSKKPCGTRCEYYVPMGLS